MTDPKNPCGLRGLAFAEFSHDEPAALETLWRAFGFSRVQQHKSLAVDHWLQGGIHLLVNREPGSFAAEFRKAHGPSISALGFAVEDARGAFEAAVQRGAKPFVGQPGLKASLDVPAVYGIGDCLVYFVDARWSWDAEFVAHPQPVAESPKGFLAIDHLTNNVHKGTLDTWSHYYKEIFGFTEVRSFDIDGAKTGLYSFALRSPDGSFCIPINEDKGGKGQIAEYLQEYKGPGVQHLAFLTTDLLASLDAMKGAVATLDIDDDYYAEVFDRVPNVSEDRVKLRKHQVLIDGDEKGYLLQIFTKNVVGPIFIELIQRKNHLSFGEGNFGALFRSIERDQEKRGVI